MLTEQENAYLENLLKTKLPMGHTREERIKELISYDITDGNLSLGNLIIKKITILNKMSDRQYVKMLKESDMSNLLKHMAIISNGRFAVSNNELPGLEEFVTSHGYLSEDIMGGIFLCWFKELDELFSNKHAHFPKDYIVGTAKTLTFISDMVIKSEATMDVGLFYSNVINTNLSNNNYPKVVFDILTENKEKFCLIIKNTSDRIINFKTQSMR